MALCNKVHEAVEVCVEKVGGHQHVSDMRAGGRELSVQQQAVELLAAECHQERGLLGYGSCCSGEGV